MENFKIDILKRLFEELWLQSNNCKQPIENISISIYEVSKSTNVPKKEIFQYLFFLLEESIIESIQSDRLLYKFTERGAFIRTKNDVENFIISLKKIPTL
jgi:hypothetical protein